MANLERCETCRFWSQMVAEAWGAGPVRALCLSPAGSPMTGKMTTGSQSCTAWKINSHGTVDNPPDYGDSARALYEAEEAQA